MAKSRRLPDAEDDFNYEDGDMMRKRSATYWESLSLPKYSRRSSGLTGRVPLAYGGFLTIESRRRLSIATVGEMLEIDIVRFVHDVNWVRVQVIEGTGSLAVSYT